MRTTRTILCFSGHDPSGGAGIQADIESINANHCHAATVITSLTAQNSKDIRAIKPLDPAFIETQTQMLIDDMPIDAIKIGMLGTAEIAQSIARLLSTLADIPVILDPVLRSGGGTGIADQELIDVIVNQIMPHVMITTPNRYEARRLSEQEDINAAANKILDLGAMHVLVTGTDGTEGDLIQHHYYSAAHLHRSIDTPRLPGHYHGSGCTLAASIAARLACGDNVWDAIVNAQTYTSATLKAARQIGKYQMHPQRIPYEQI